MPLIQNAEHWLEKVWEELRAELVKLFGDNSGVHTSVDDAKKKALEAEMAQAMAAQEVKKAAKVPPPATQEVALPETGATQEGSTAAQ